MAYATFLFAEESDDLGGVTDTFLLAGWLQIPPFDDTVQVFAPIADEWGIFFIELAFSSGIMTLIANIRESYSGDFVCGGGTGMLDDLPAHPYIQGGWNSFALSCRFSTGTMQYMLNRQLLDPNVDFYTNNLVTVHENTGWSIGPGRAPPGFALSDWRWSYGEPFFDLLNPANVARLFGGGPVDWGPAGEYVTGLVPKVFLHGSSDTYMDNLGSLGRFTVGDTLPLLDTPGPGYGVSGSMSISGVTTSSGEGVVSTTTIERLP
jgi:hypothetical protein